MHPDKLNEMADTYNTAVCLAAADTLKQARLVQESLDWDRTAAIWHGGLQNVVDDTFPEIQQIANRDVSREEYETDIADIVRLRTARDDGPQYE